MNYYGDPITRLIEKFASLPGIGRKSAQRLAFHVIAMDDSAVAEPCGGYNFGKREMLNIVQYAVILRIPIFARYVQIPKEITKQ